MSAQFVHSDVIRAGLSAKNISDSAAAIYWLASHNVDVSFHIAQLEGDFDQLAAIISALRESRKPVETVEQVAA